VAPVVDHTEPPATLNSTADRCDTNTEINMKLKRLTAAVLAASLLPAAAFAGDVEVVVVTTP